MVNTKELTERSAIPVKHSGYGIASFVVSLAMAVAYLMILYTVWVLNKKMPDGVAEEPILLIIFGLLLLGLVVVSLIGVAVGATGVNQRDRKKVYAILGIVFNVIVVLLSVALVVFFFVIV